MNIQTERFARKPVLVDAVRVTAENMAEVAVWCNGNIVYEVKRIQGKDENVAYVHVRVMNPARERQCRGYVGDWVLYTTNGYKAYTHSAFLKAFDPHNEEGSEKVSKAAMEQAARVLAEKLIGLCVAV